MAAPSPPPDTPAPANAACGDNESLLIELSKQLEECPLIDAHLPEQPLLLDDSSSSMASNSNTKFWARMFNQQQQAPLPSTTIPTSAGATVAAATTSSVKANNKPSQSQSNQTGSSSGNNNAWLELFADLDPLANPQAFDLKMSGGRRVAEQT